MQKLFIKARLFIKEYSMFDFCRKLIDFSCNKFRFNLFNKIKSLYYFKSNNIDIKKGLHVEGQCYNVSCGKGIQIYPDCKFEFSKTSIFNLGDNVLFSYGVVVSCRSKISIGNNVQIGEYVSIRDSTHDYNDYGVPIKLNNDILEPIEIGNNIWIGRGSIIFPGTTIEDGVVIGANSVVKGRLLANGIYAGAPLILIKSRR